MAVVVVCQFITRDIRILRQKIASLHAIFANISTRFFYGTIYDTGVLSRVSWVVGPHKLRVTIQLTLSLRSYLPTTRSSNNVVWRMYIVYICDRKLTTSGILCNFNRCRWKGQQKSAKFLHFLCHLVNFPQFCAGPQILRRVANCARTESQNPDIPIYNQCYQLAITLLDMCTSSFCCQMLKRSLKVLSRDMSEPNTYCY